MHTLEELIIQEAATLYQQGRHETLRAWLRRVPWSNVEKDPWLLYWSGMCSMLDDTDGSVGFFERALARFEQEGIFPGAFLALSGISESLTFGFDTYQFYDRWFEKAEALCHRCPKPPSLEAEVRLTVSMLNGVTMRKPCHDEARQWQIKGLALVDRRQGVGPELKLQLLNPLILNRVTAGALAEAGLLLESYKSLAARHEIPPLARIILKNLEALYCWRRGDGKGCIVCVDGALQLAGQHGIKVLTAILLANGASGALIDGRTTLAEKYLARLEQQLESAGVYIKQLYSILKAWLHILKKQSTQACEHARRSLHFAQLSGNPEGASVSSLAAAISFFVSGECDESIGWLEDAQKKSRKGACRQVEFACAFFGAEIAYASGNHERGREELEKALIIGRCNDYVVFPLWRPGAAALLCCRALGAGIETEYVCRLIQSRQLSLASPPVKLESWPWQVRIYCFGRFEIVRQGLPLRPMNKARQKPLTLLKLIIASGGRKVPVHQLARELWPDADGDMQVQSFNTTLHRLRRLLNIKDAVVLHSGEVTLNNHLCWVDVWCFERLARSTFRPSGQNDCPRDASAAEKAAELYHGPFLSGDACNWAVPQREKLHNKFTGVIEKLGHRLITSGQWTEAMNCYRRGIEAAPLVESFYHQLMVCHIQMGHDGDASLVYRQYRRILMATLGLSPSKSIEALYRKIKSTGD